VVDVDADRQPAATVLTSVDAALAARSPAVRVLVRMADGHPGRGAIEAACAADPRIAIVDRDATRPGDGRALVIAVPAGVEPGEQTLEQLARLVDEAGGPVAAAVPGALRWLDGFDWAARLPHRRVVRASIGGDGGRPRRRVAGARIGIVGRGVARFRFPPPGELPHERSEHLRHRARLNTNDARVAGGAQRLARERLALRRHQARIASAERRIGSTGALAWIAWRARQLGSLARAGAGMVAELGGALRRRLRRLVRLLLRPLLRRL